MSIMLRKLKGKTIKKEGEGAEWEHIITLLKILSVLFIIFSSFHWVIKKRVQHLPAQTQATTNQTTQSHTLAQTAKQYKVKEGDTLWKIAVQYYPTENPLEVINRIKQINKLSKDDIKPGQSIKLP